MAKFDGWTVLRCYVVGERVGGRDTSQFSWRCGKRKKNCQISKGQEHVHRAHIEKKLHVKRQTKDNRGSMT